MRHSITISKTTLEIQEAVGMKDQVKDQEDGDWKSTLTDLGEVMKNKWGWDWIKETENVIEEGEKTKENQLKEEEESMINGTETSKVNSAAEMDPDGTLEAEKKIEEVAHEPNPPPA